MKAKRRNETAKRASESPETRKKIDRLKFLMDYQQPKVNYTLLDIYVPGASRELRGGTRRVGGTGAGKLATAFWGLHEQPELAGMSNEENRSRVDALWTDLGKEINNGTVLPSSIDPAAFNRLFVEWFFSLPPSRPLASLKPYLEAVFEHLSELPLAAVTSTPQSSGTSRARMSLPGVYVGLDTRTPRMPEDLEAQHRSGLLRHPEQEKTPISALEALAENPHVVLLGDPGAGKSTFAKHLCVCLAAQGLDQKGDWGVRVQPLPGGDANLVPIFVELRRFADRLTVSPTAGTLARQLWNFIQDSLNDYPLDQAAIGRALQNALQNGRGLVVFDGLDEVATQERKLLVRDAIEQFASGNFNRSRMVITCRTRSYRDRPWQFSPPDEDNPHGFGGPFELADFDEVKIQGFVRRWYVERGKVDRLPDDDVKRLIDSLWDAIRDPHFPELIEVARSPLRLTVMALVHNHDESLPRESAKLYSRMVEILLFRWEGVRWRGHPHAASLVRLLAEAEVKEPDFIQELARLAHDVHARAAKNGPLPAGDSKETGGESEAHSREDQSLKVLKDDLEKALKRLHSQGDGIWRARVIALIKERAGLLMEVDEDVFDFPHASFREYLAGLHLANSPDFPQCGDLIDPSRHWWEVVKWAAGWIMHVNTYQLARPSLRDLVKLLAGSEPLTAPAAWLKVILAGEVVVIMRGDALVKLQDGRACLDLVKQRLLKVMKGSVPSPSEREQAGIVLGKLGDPRDGVELREDGLPDIDWVDLPAGRFELGISRRAFKIERPLRISRYPVTWKQYQAFVDAPDGYREESHWAWLAEAHQWWRKNKDSGPEDYEPVFQTPNHPRVGVCWFEAVAFCRWLSEKLGQEVRLPHEGEWEWAARCVLKEDKRGRPPRAEAHNLRFPWGRDADNELADRCNCWQTGIRHTSAVGLFPDGKAKCGAMDLSGNVWEWCDNWHDDKSKSSRVLRGGSWAYINPEYLSCAFRYVDSPGYRLDFIGFRCVWVGLASAAG
ncbi:MAG: SUMF1/EgtB/PvdO family nonheme iron enzyme [Verrucomicrobiales bacterium]|nr:SUMF1/EgtB/PvdO family nonheme iron enzyme [Verrucomicrobiales bacterium]MCP5525031.1 SUMF1/EgtB/PvdO family nonheme iron enzyme [Verrucomicrobiales bacterium]